MTPDPRTEEGNRTLLFMVPAIKPTPETGGELYNLHVANALADRFDLRTLTLADLGVADWRGEPRLADLATRAAISLAPRGIVLQDSYFYEVFRPVNVALRRAGLGPIIAFGQAMYPERYVSMLARSKRYVALARYLHSCDGHIVVSEAMKRTYLRLGIPERRIVVVHPGQELERIPPLRERKPADNRALRVVVAGSYQPSKGQTIVVDGLLRLLRQRPDFASRLHVDFHGNRDFSAEFYQSLRNKVVTAGLAGVVQLGESLPREELWNLLADSDLLIFPASGEGLPIVVVEAMLNGCVPALAHNGSSDSIVADGRTGFLIPRSPAGVAGVLERVLDAPSMLPAMSAASARAARVVACDWHETMRRFSIALRQLVDDSQALSRAA